MNTSNRWTCEGPLTIYRAANLKTELMQALAQSDGLELDLSKVEEIDTAGLQLLILAKREAARLGKAVAIVAHSQAVREVIEFCQMASYFGDPLVIAAGD